MELETHVDNVLDGSAHAGTHDEHAVEVVLQNKGLDERADEEQAGEAPSPVALQL